MADASVRIAAASFDPEAEIAAFRRAHPDAGAIVTFVGQVRSDAGAVKTLTLDHYPGFTDVEIARIANEAFGRWRLDGVLIVHRVGALEPGDPIVLAAAAAAHRRDAFQAVDFLMDYLKTGAPFWKKETALNGESWIEPRASDYEDKMRWAIKPKE